ncbi:uncharacterized protein FTJAE_9374 [Fusarium tjaetaba]|uniref:Uncharacterized protein n=1 Tax=Fusarium tjaetaba TaxID=1567544 RepID=A0A8H5VNG3_9HYPO|nr:uncharacterized protein FTJAE_9374 [Fusarium tjaetaba]KAF5627289.1 hypothetical protein FTJAE_9374 [Fusarium tjaetaba]
MGNDTYAIHPNPIFSGGPSCKTDVDSVNQRILVYCTMLYWDYTDIISDMKTVDTHCFGPWPPLRGQFDSDYYKSDPMPKIGRRCGKKEKKKKEGEQIAPLYADGAGWPHQRYLYQQISDVVHCGRNHTCCVSSDRSQTATWSAQFLQAMGTNINVANVIHVCNQITLGWSIAMAWTEGNSYTCHGNPGDQVCIWYRVAHTAFVIREPVAPHNGNEGGGVICKYNDECRSMGERFWDCYGRQDEHLRWCPPPGYPPKLDRSKRRPQQCPESDAIYNAKLERMRETIAAKGIPAWKDQQRESKELEDRLEIEDEEKWGTLREQEKMEEERLRREAEALERKRKKKAEKDLMEDTEDKEDKEDKEEDTIQVPGSIDF